jgi:phenylacetate-coenzyme A ligase PaaK-like adenylate-forming protein
MDVKQKYWNPVLETLPHEKIRQLQLNKFKQIFKWTYDHSKFHRQLYDQSGIKPEDIRSFKDIKQVPKVEKSMMRDIQRKDPFPPDQRDHRTTGLSARYLAGLGVVGRMLVIYSLGPGVPSSRPGVYSLWL